MKYYQLIPQEYLKFREDLEDGEVQNKFNYLYFYSLHELEEIHEDTLAEKLIPSYTIFCTDSNGTVLAFQNNTHKIYAFELIGMSEIDAVFVSNSFEEFIKRFENEEIEIY